MFEAEAAKMQSTACPSCYDIRFCPTEPKGWQVFADVEDSEYYGAPAYRYRKCAVLKQHETVKTAEKAVSERFKEREFETFKTNARNLVVHKMCVKYAEEFDAGTFSGLFFVGRPGTGKTHLAVAILKTIAKKGFSALMVTVPNVLVEIRAVIKDSEATGKLINQVLKTNFLVLDDLGVEKPTDWVREELYKLINERYERKLPTLVTSNLDLDKLADRIGERVVDRLVEMCKVIRFDWDSWRRK
jgi:DNA replication protein DnaC